MAPRASAFDAPRQGKREVPRCLVCVLRAISACLASCLGGPHHCALPPGASCCCCARAVHHGAGAELRAEWPGCGSCWNHHAGAGQQPGPELRLRQGGCGPVQAGGAAGGHRRLLEGHGREQPVRVSYRVRGQPHGPAQAWHRGASHHPQRQQEGGYGASVLGLPRRGGTG